MPDADVEDFQRRGWNETSIAPERGLPETANELVGAMNWDLWYFGYCDWAHIC